MIKTIRPFEIFTMAGGSVTLPIPIRRNLESGCPTLLETFLLIAIARSVNAQRIFEFGTCMGTTAHALVSNLDAHLWTLDLGEEKQSITQVDDLRAMKTALSSRVKDYSGMSQVTELRGDSLTFNFRDYFGKVNFVFVDGAHDYETVASDGDNALAMLDSNAPGAVVFHDYGVPVHPGVKQYIEELSHSREIVHVADTTLAVYFNR